MEINKKTPETTEDAGQVIEEVGKCFEEVEEEPRITLTRLFNNLMTGPDVERPTLESREQWEARRKDAIRTALIDALSKNGTLPAEWVLEWNERCEG